MMHVITIQQQIELNNCVVRFNQRTKRSRKPNIGGVMEAFKNITNENPFKIIVYMILKLKPT